MDEYNDADGIEQRLTQLGNAEPDPARVDAAQQRVRDELSAAEMPAVVSAATTRHRWRTVGVPVAIAALIAIAASVAFLPPRYAPVQQASAADRLKQVIAKNRAYEGWVFQTWPGDEDHGALYHTESGAFLTRYRREDEHEPTPFYSTEGIDLERQLLFRHVNPGNTVIYSLPSPQWRRYRYEREISRESVLEEIEQWLERDVATVLEQGRAATGEDIYRVVYYERVYDDEGNAVGRTDTELGRQEYWVDPESGLLHQVRSLTPEGEAKIVNTFAYGEAAEQVLASFWPPEDAKVIDGRPDEATQALIEAVYGHIEAGLSPGVWAMARRITIQDELYEGERVYGELFLLTRSSQGICELNYHLKSDAIEAPRAAVLPLSLYDNMADDAAVLAAVEVMPPRRVWRSDGRVFWRYELKYADDRAYLFDDDAQGRHPYPFELSRHDLASHCAAGHAWLGSYGSPWFHNHGAEVSRVEDPARLGLIGLRVIERTSPSALWVTDQDTWWFDPQRNHVLVEIEKITFAQRNRTEQSLEPSAIDRTLSTEFEQNAQGLWYPSAWHREIRVREDLTDDAWSFWFETEGRLIHYPDAELDPLWFGDPRATVNGWLAERAGAEVPSE